MTAPRPPIIPICENPTCFGNNSRAQKFCSTGCRKTILGDLLAVDAKRLIGALPPISTYRINRDPYKNHATQDRMSAAQLSKFLGVTPVKVSRWFHNKVIPGYRLNPKRLVFNAKIVQAELRKRGLIA